jgi:hypothetical protein
VNEFNTKISSSYFYGCALSHIAEIPGIEALEIEKKMLLCAKTQSRVADLKRNFRSADAKNPAKTTMFK